MSKYDPLPAGTDPLVHFMPGVVPSPSDARDHVLTEEGALVATPFFALPSAAGLSREADLVVKNQGQKGSCMIFTGVGIAEYALLTLPQSRRIDGSEEFGYARQLELLERLCHSEQGTYPRSVMDMIVKEGILLESQRPYTADSCRGTTQAERDQAATQRYWAEYVACRTFNAIKAAIVADQMVACCISLCTNFVPGRDGVIPPPNGVAWGGHAMRFTRYDDNKVTDYGVGAWRILNQWDRSWGENGYAWLPYSGFNRPADQGGIWLSDAWTLRPKAVVPPPTEAKDEFYVQTWRPQADGGWDIQTVAKVPVDQGMHVTVKRSQVSGGVTREQIITPFTWITPATDPAAS